MRSLAVAGIALVLVVIVLFLGTCGRSEVEAPTTTTSTTTSTTSTTSSTTTTTTVDPASLGTLPPVDGIGAPVLDRDSSVTTVGLDTVHFGMTLRAAQLAAGSRFSPASPVGECYLVTPDEAPDGISFWVAGGTIERVDIDEPGITTRSGAGIGDSEDRIHDMFGDRIQATALPDGTGNLLAYVPRDESDKDYRVMFQTDGEKVVRFWSGKLPWAGMLEPCG
ncbi:MAG: hypothetical protein QF575_00020 [Acidimicrobiales bacterium]|jgi:hypothetical protein|nr:hypothetical protein [Acidimicrobiales bacterium]